MGNYDSVVIPYQYIHKLSESDTRIHDSGGLAKPKVTSPLIASIESVAITTGDNTMYSGMDCTKRAKSLWMDICCMYFDYDSSSWVTNKAYNIHLEIEHILRTGKCWDGGWDA